jgi:hypothetical protein
LDLLGRELLLEFLEKALFEHVGVKLRGAGHGAAYGLGVDPVGDAPTAPKANMEYMIEADRQALEVPVQRNGQGVVDVLGRRGGVR